jgi:hypothetical protein
MITAPHNMYGINVFKIFVDEISIQQAAKILDVTERSIFRWIATEKVPKAAVLALYWESKYGRSLIDVEHDREVSSLRGQISCYQSQFRRAKEIIAGLRAMNYGTANEPFYDEGGTFTIKNTDTALSVLDSGDGKLAVSTTAKTRSTPKHKPRQAAV